MFIKKCGRVPASDSLAVKRIAGPGLALDYFFNIKPEQALAAFEAKMELEELQAYQQSMESIILQPQKDFSQFVEACFGPFSAQLSKTGPYRLLEREGKELMTSLHEKLEKRRQDLQIGLTTVVKTKIKLNTMELKVIAILLGHVVNISNYGISFVGCPATRCPFAGEILSESRIWQVSHQRGRVLGLEG